MQTCSEHTSNDVYIKRHTGRRRRGRRQRWGETVVEKGGSTSGRSCPWCPAPISSRRSSSHSWPLVTSSRRSAPPRRSGRTGHGTGRLRTGEIVEWMARRDTKTRKTAESARDNPPLSSSSCAHTVLTHTSLLMTYTRRRLRGEQTGVTGHEEEKPMSSLCRWNKILNWLFIRFLDQAWANNGPSSS